MGGAHGCAESPQKTELGSSQAASSNEPALTKRKPGINSTSLHKGDPQSGQKYRVTPWPLFPSTRKPRGSPPWDERAASPTTAKLAKALPVDLWQSVQWQWLAERTPARSISKRIAPHRHPPLTVSSLDIAASDLPMRWYGLRGEFTNAFFLGGNDTKSKVNTGLNAAMDRSSIHHTMDQGWSGHMGIYDYNIANLTASKYVKPSYK